MIERTPVESTTIKSVGHDPLTNTLAVEFKNGAVYHYHDCPAEKHEAMMSAASVGSHFAAHVKPHHRFEKQ